MIGKTAIITGATGLIGSHLVRTLLQDVAYEKIIAISRRPLDLDSHKLEQVITDFKNEEWVHAFTGHDYFCCLGTTMAKAGSKEAFKHTDHDLIVRCFEAAMGKASTVCLVSSMGADTRSLVYYNHIKGLTEAALKQLNFPRAFVLRPSLLIGERTEKRTMEYIAQKTAGIWDSLLQGPLKKYQSIGADTVAKAMIILANSDRSQGFYIFESDKIKDITK